MAIGNGDYSEQISIHAPAKGATTMDLEHLINYGISIHAPAKGATWCPYLKVEVEDISIHAPAKGATRYASEKMRKRRFQSTLPRRERRNRRKPDFARTNFNPRSREGSDGQR